MTGDKPVSFVFHGGSGSSREDIRYAIEAGTIKMNIDTDTQWAFWDGIREYEAKNRDYLQGQIGNPEGETKPNKKYYDPRMPLRARGGDGQSARPWRTSTASTSSKRDVGGPAHCLTWFVGRRGKAMPPTLSKISRQNQKLPLAHAAAST